MKKVITSSLRVPWSYYNNRFDVVDERYLPSSGEGDTIATQIATAVNKLIYKWYNDGDVFDNTYYLDGWANDLSDYANWLHSNIPEAKSILEQISTAITEADYEQILKKLADTLLDSEFIGKYAEVPKVGSVYECSGPFEFVEGYDEYDDEFYDDVIEWFDDASASVMDADWTADGEIIVSLDHNVQDIETAAAELISCIESNGYHVSDWNVNGHNVFIFEIISNDEYAELADGPWYILEDDGTYSATALYQNPYDEEGEDVECATVADNGEQVFQLMEYDSDPEAGIEGDDFYCYGEFFATDEDDALKQLEEAKSAYPKFASLADQARLFVHPYNEHFSTGGEIYQNVSAIAQHLNQDFHDEEIPFA